jgi:hypothetical protein
MTEKQRTFAGLNAENVDKQLTIVKDKVESVGEDVKENIRISNRRKSKKFPNDSSSSSSSDDEKPDKKKIVFDTKRKTKKYTLIHPDAARNQISIEQLKSAISGSESGEQLEEALTSLKLTYTNFQVERGDMNDDIFERMIKTGCIPQPRGIVCTRCGYNIYDEKDSFLKGLMARHYTTKHNKWFRDNGMEQFFRIYGPNCSGTFTSKDGITDFDYFQTGMYYCKKLNCQKINSKKESDLNHLRGVHGHKWEAWGDMNPFWRILKINLKDKSEANGKQLSSEKQPICT